MAVPMPFNVNHSTNQSLLSILNIWYSEELRCTVLKGVLTRGHYGAVNTYVPKDCI